MKYFVRIGEHTREVEIAERLGRVVVEVDGVPFDLSYEEADRSGQVTVLHDGKSYALSIEGDGEEVGVTLAGHFYGAAIEDERERAAHLAERTTAGAGGIVESVMPGVVVRLLVGEGDRVEKGDPLLILEAMKMQNEICSGWNGRVKRVYVEAGKPVGTAEKLVAIEGDEAPPSAGS